MKPFVMTSSMQNMRGVFYPTGYLFVMLPTQEDAARLAQALRGDGGCDEDDLMLLKPETILGEISHSVRSDGNVFPSVGSEAATVRRYDELARQGHCALMIHAPSALQTERVMEIVHRSPFSCAEKYRRLVIEDMD